MLRSDPQARCVAEEGEERTEHANRQYDVPVAIAAPGVSGLTEEVNVRSRMAGVRHDPHEAELSVQVVDPDHSAWGPLEAERWAIAAHRVNVLVQGTSPFISETLAVLRRDLDHREFIWPDRPVAGNTPSATVVVREIGELSSHALDALAHLIVDTRSWVQVIVTSSVVLYELVERGQFPADLYYRLNIVVLTDDGCARSGQVPPS